MTAMLTLDLALITFGPDGIRRVGAMNLPRIDGVHYVVSWQCGGDAAVPASLIRPDISVCRTQSRGAAVNRNNAIAIRAYQNNGFTVICEQKSDIGNGFFMDDFVMEKTLSD